MKRIEIKGGRKGKTPLWIARLPFSQESFWTSCREEAQVFSSTFMALIKIQEVNPKLNPMIVENN